MSVFQNFLKNAIQQSPIMPIIGLILFVLIFQVAVNITAIILSQNNKIRYFVSAQNNRQFIINLQTGSVREISTCIESNENCVYELRTIRHK